MSSPVGNGRDCHRTWELLFFGVVPIVRTSTLDALYDNLPVIIVSEWSAVSEPKKLESKWGHRMSILGTACAAPRDEMNCLKPSLEINCSVSLSEIPLTLMARLPMETMPTRDHTVLRHHVISN